MRTTTAFLFAASALAVAGCGGGKSSTPTTTAVPTTTATATTTAAPTTTTSPTTTAASATTIAILVKGGKPVGGIKRAEVDKGTKVVLVVRSDVADEVHLHGYDKHVDVEAGGTARLPFVANIAGVFEAELESRKLQILELTVQ